MRQIVAFREKTAPQRRGGRNAAVGRNQANRPRPPQRDIEDDAEDKDEDD